MQALAVLKGEKSENNYSVSYCDWEKKSLDSDIGFLAK